MYTVFPDKDGNGFRIFLASGEIIHYSLDDSGSAVMVNVENGRDNALLLEQSFNRVAQTTASLLIQDRMIGDIRIAH